jgi:hypothetical protein
MTTTTDTEFFIPGDTAEIARQVGRMNVLAISGGRITHRPTGITLPIRYGYSVTVDLTAMDDYVVRCVFTRGAKTWIKKEWTGVYCDEVGEVAYQASCYHHH